MAYTYLVPTWVILWEIALHDAWPNWAILGGVLLTISALLVLLKNEHTEKWHLDHGSAKKG